MIHVYQFVTTIMSTPVFKYHLGSLFFDSSDRLKTDVWKNFQHLSSLNSPTDVTYIHDVIVK